MIHTPAEESTPLLDARGCLTYGAMAFVEQLDADQQALVNRHVGACSACAQQQLLLKLGADMIRRNGPRVVVPREARQAARQAVARSLPSPPTAQRRPQRWSLLGWVLRSPAVAGAVIAIAAASTGLLMAHLFG